MAKFVVDCDAYFVMGTHVVGIQSLVEYKK